MCVVKSGASSFPNGTVSRAMCKMMTGLKIRHCNRLLDHSGVKIVLKLLLIEFTYYLGKLNHRRDSANTTKNRTCDVVKDDWMMKVLIS